MISTEFLQLIIFFIGIYRQYDSNFHSLSGHVDFVLYTERIKVQYNLYISDHLYLKTMLLFQGGCGFKKQVSNAQIVYSYLLFRNNSVYSRRFYNAHNNQILGTNDFYCSITVLSAFTITVLPNCLISLFKLICTFQSTKLMYGHCCIVLFFTLGEQRSIYERP